MNRRAAARAPGRRWAAAMACAATLAGPAWAAEETNSGLLPTRTVSVNLRFQISIHKFLFFRLGDGAWPNKSSTVNKVEFVLQPAGIPGSTAPHPVEGSNNAPVNWTGGAPSFSVTATNNVLPVEVRSNAGTVTLKVDAINPLTNGGGQTIPISAIDISSSDGALPPPSPPEVGQTATVATGGPGSDFAQVTQRSANWTFSFAPGDASGYAAGTYHGRITFSASAP